VTRLSASSGSGGDHSGSSPQRIRAALVARLRQRSSEIEAAVFARVRSLGEPVRGEDQEYLAGLRAAVVETLDYALAGIERGDEGNSRPLPAAAIAQARRAARDGVKLDTILRRYAAGDRRLSEFILSQSDHFPAEILQRVLSELGPTADRFMAAVALEYKDELERIRRSPSVRVAERVQRLLDDGGFVEVDDLDYQFDAWHLGVIAKGSKVADTVRVIASDLDREALNVPRGDETIWSWLGGRRPVSVADVERSFLAHAQDDTYLAIGEPREGLRGWRLTHHEAQAALQVMQCQHKRFTRGTDVLLPAAVLRDGALVESLRETYVRPLDDLGVSGVKLRRTLQTYLATGFNAESTASALGINRSTVERHLHKIEDRLGRQLHTCHADLRVALELRELSDRPSPWYGS
jgi:hypothetical protein